MPKTDVNPSFLIKSSGKGPAYIQLAALIQDKICSGEFTPGAKIPAEATMSKTYGVAVMTVRQAIQVLAEKGILRRVHGSGTFVCAPDWTRASFPMEGILDKLSDKDNLQISIIKAKIVEATEKAAESLRIEPGEIILSLVRLVSYKGEPFLLNKAYLKYDKNSLIVESELEVSSVFSLFTGEGSNFVKKSLLELVPAILSASEAQLLRTQVDVPAFKVLYTFYGYNDLPVGSGWFLTTRGNVSFTARIGVWDD
ncbi:MAG: GntR family transcriptional regulator [Deltaproteobacteria bacterium]|nr:GntR family transcriptional regulator [Deltaproteobacteria bacterium]